MRERVVLLLREMAEAMRKSGDRARLRAYSRAADNIEERKDFEDLHSRKRLQAISGVGPSIERTIVAFLDRGERPAWLDDRSKLPRRIGSSAAWRASTADARLGAAAIEPPEAYFLAPFPDAPDLHVHTTWSDGSMPLDDAVAWARQLGANSRAPPTATARARCFASQRHARWPMRLARRRRIS